MTAELSSLVGVERFVHGTAEIEVEKSRFFNSLGIPGWYLNACVLKRKSVPGFQARLNDWLVPLLRLEKHVKLPWGMSLLAVGRKP